MKRLLALSLILIAIITTAEDDPFQKMNFLVGKWAGTGSGFGNATSKIESSFKLIMDGKYIEVKNESRFAPTEDKPEGEYHIDRGIISYDKSREIIVYRQFNNEGYVNQYSI